MGTKSGEKKHTFRGTNISGRHISSERLSTNRFLKVIVKPQVVVWSFNYCCTASNQIEAVFVQIIDLVL